MKYKVIVADDEDVIRKGIVYLIDWDKLNCEIVQECTDGLQVLKYLEKNTADIVITDIQMPKLSGIELMEEIDKKHKGLCFCPTHAALFSAHLISFDKDGKLIISDKIDEEERKILKIENGMPAKMPFSNRRMQLHRKKFNQESRGTK